MDKSKKTIYIIAAVAFVLIIAAIYFLFIRQRSADKVKTQESTDIVKSISEIDNTKRPYVTLTPTSDGAEIIISIEKMADFDKIEYELTYLADNPQLAGEKITRGHTGNDANTKDEKYKKSMLLGTGSKGVKSPDKGITDGKLTLHLYKGDTDYQSETNWDMFEVGQSATTIKSRDDKLELTLPSLGKPYWIILADTVGIPPKNESLDSKTVFLPIYGAFSTAPAPTKPVGIKIKVDSQFQDLVLRTYLQKDSHWDETIKSGYDLKTQIFTAKVKTFATYIVASK